MFYLIDFKKNLKKLSFCSFSLFPLNKVFGMNNNNDNNVKKDDIVINIESSNNLDNNNNNNGIITKYSSDYNMPKSLEDYVDSYNNTVGKNKKIIGLEFLDTIDNIDFNLLNTADLIDVLQELCDYLNSHCKSETFYINKKGITNGSLKNYNKNDIFELTVKDIFLNKNIVNPNYKKKIDKLIGKIYSIKNISSQKNKKLKDTLNSTLYRFYTNNLNGCFNNKITIKTKIKEILNIGQNNINSDSSIEKLNKSNEIFNRLQNNKQIDKISLLGRKKERDSEISNILKKQFDRIILLNRKREIDEENKVSEEFIKKFINNDKKNDFIEKISNDSIKEILNNFIKKDINNDLKDDKLNIISDDFINQCIKDDLLENSEIKKRFKWLKNKKEEKCITVIKNKIRLQYYQYVIEDLKKVLLKVMSPEMLLEFEFRLKNPNADIKSVHFDKLFMQKIGDFIYKEVTVTFEKKRLNILSILQAYKNEDIMSFLNQPNLDFYRRIFLNNNGLKELYNIVNNINIWDFQNPKYFRNLGRNAIIIATQMYYFRFKKNILASRYLVENVVLPEIVKLILNKNSNVKKYENIKENNISFSIISPMPVKKYDNINKNNSSFSLKSPIFVNEDENIKKNNSSFLFKSPMPVKKYENIKGNNSNFFLKSPIFVNEDENIKKNNISFHFKSPMPVKKGYNINKNNSSSSLESLISVQNICSNFGSNNNNMKGSLISSNMNNGKVYSGDIVVVNNVTYKKVMIPGDGNCLLYCLLYKFNNDVFECNYICDSLQASKQLKIAANTLRASLGFYLNDLISNQNLNMENDDLTQVQNELLTNNAYLSTDVLRIISKYYDTEILLRIYQKGIQSGKEYIQYKKFTNDSQEINITEDQFNSSESLKISYSVSLDGVKQCYNGHYEVLEK